MSADDLNRQIFKEEAYDLLVELEGALLELEEAPDDMDLVNQIFRALHTIKGSGSMFGFEAIAAFTHEVETVFDMVRNGDLEPSPLLCGLALRSRDQIRAMLEAEGDEPVDPESMEEILAGLREFVTGTDEAEEAPEKVEEAGEAVPEEAEAGPPRSYAITLKPLGGELDIDGVETFFEELERLGDLRVLSGHRETGHGWELSLETEADRDSVQDVFFGSSG